MCRWVVLLLSASLSLGTAADVVAAKRKLTPEQRYRRIVKKVAPLYGLDSAPSASFGKSAASRSRAATVLAPGQDPHITFSRGGSKLLTSRDPFKRRQGRQMVLWELGRVERFNNGDWAGASEPAPPWLIHKTNKVSRRLNKQQAQNRRYLKK